MRNFSWKYFAMTGDVDAYLLYKEAGDSPTESELPLVEDEMAIDEEA